MNKLPKEIVDEIKRHCPRCSHEWMPKILVDGSIIKIRSCPNCGRVLNYDESGRIIE